MSDTPPKRVFTVDCPICNQTQAFACQDDFWHCRDGMSAPDCPLNGCVTRERALASVIYSLIDRTALPTLDVHEPAPVMRGLSLLLARDCPGYVRSGYYPNQPFGTMIAGVRNEDLEHQTFADASFDLVIHLDVMEHLFDPFQALREVARTLRPGGLCVFTAPTEPSRFDSEQVAFMEEGELRIVGEPEYHGNPQRPEDGALLTWRYGYDLPLLIQRRTGLDVEVRRFQSREVAAMGVMNEIYVLRKSRARIAG